MEMTMTCNNLCNADPDWLRSIEEMVCETVIFFRNRGHRRDAAIEQAALALGLTNRRTWSFFYQQPVATVREEFESIRQAFARHLEYQAADYIRRSEIVRAKLRQIELDV